MAKVHLIAAAGTVDAQVDGLELRAQNVLRFVVVAKVEERSDGHHEDGYREQ